ncbi:MAG: hypothetical protein FWD69_05435 [Polyangiaceae bacterium]|nr:hypothetical protein [Polyangiaceae bacterium]
MRNLFISLGALASAGFFLHCGGGTLYVEDGTTSVCEPTNAPSNVSEDYGAFVDADVDPTAEADGSKDKPFKTIDQALETLAGRFRVFVCASQSAYAEQVILPSNVSLYGGFECGTWTYNCDKPMVAPEHPGVVLNIINQSAIVVSDIEFVAKDGPIVGSSSIAVFVSNSTDVTFHRVTATAGKGADGKPGDTPPSNYFSDTLTDLYSNTADGGTGAGEKTCTCQDGTSSTGGAGGNAGTDPLVAAHNGQPGSANPPVTKTGWGVGGSGYDGTQVPPVACNDRTASGGTPIGTDANAGGNGGHGASSYGTLSSTDWTPTPGGDGTNGFPGQGGGGGGGGDKGGGGSGACGGCGGSRGLGGQGGGASIAIALYESTLTLDTCTLQTDNAGNGRNGSTGQVGGGGGEGRGSYGTGCAGGNGGNGSGGGGGGGGAGGISVGVLYSSGSTFNQDNATTITVGNAGLPGAAGLSSNGGSPSAAAGNPGNPGIVGVAQPTLQLDP